MHITHPHLLLNVVHIHLRVDLQELVSSAGESRPPSWHLQLSIVGVPATKNREQGYWEGLSSFFHHPVFIWLLLGFRVLCLQNYTQFWQSWSSRQSCSRRHHGGEASSPVVWWKAFRRHTAGHRRDQLPSNWDRACQCHPYGWAVRRGTSTYVQSFIETRRQTWQSLNQTRSYISPYSVIKLLTTSINV